MSRLGYRLHVRPPLMKVHNFWFEFLLHHLKLINKSNNTLLLLFIIFVLCIFRWKYVINIFVDIVMDCVYVNFHQDNCCLYTVKVMMIQCIHYM